MPSIVVIGSVNLDIVATVPCLPAAGETVTDAVLARYPGGRGANQALAARRLGADVVLVGRVGKDAEADAALALLREGDVDLSGVVAVSVLCEEAEDQPHQEVIHVGEALHGSPFGVVFQQLDIELVKPSRRPDIEGTFANLLDGGDSG